MGSNFFKNWSPQMVEDFNRRVAHGTTKNNCKTSCPQPERVVQSKPVDAPKRKAAYSGVVSISVTSYRTRLCDPDNLCPKYFIDSLRYSGLISDDRPEDITLTVRQHKVGTKAEERTEILITPV